MSKKINEVHFYFLLQFLGYFPNQNLDENFDNKRAENIKIYIIITRYSVNV